MGTAGKGIETWGIQCLLFTHTHNTSGVDKTDTVFMRIWPGGEENDLISGPELSKGMERKDGMPYPCHSTPLHGKD